MTRYWAEHAWLGGEELTVGVTLDVAGGVFTGVTGDTAAPADAIVLAGITIPGFANAHSHAFHRALRGRTQRGGGTFWTWREQMYAVAGLLTPDTYFSLARATFAEMALAGVTCVGEFHYVHHNADGTPYDEPNAMGYAVLAAATAAGIRITLLDTCYLTGGIGAPLQGPQVRFGDGDAQGWAARAAALRPTPTARIGAAIHSVRAVPAEQLRGVVDWAAGRQAPLHVHVSEQQGENTECLAVYGASPTQLLADNGALGERTTAVHATHLTTTDVAALGRSGTTVCMCPSTERDLADGLGLAGPLAAAGSPLSLGSDSNATIDLFEEMRGLEHGERLRSGRRGHWSAAQLLGIGAAHASLGWPEAGRLAVGAVADFVTVRTATVRMAAASCVDALVFAATAADVSDVVVGGQRIVAGGVHQLVDDVPHALATSMAAVTGE